jgi:hypothetical protein
VFDRHQSPGENGLKVRAERSTWSCVCSFGFFRPEEATISAPCCHEFPIVERRDPFLEACSSDADALLLNIRVKCSSFRAKAAHLSGHLPAGHNATGWPLGACLLSQGVHGACLHTHAVPSKRSSRPLRSAGRFRDKRKPTHCPGSEHCHSTTRNPPFCRHQV